MLDLSHDWSVAKSQVQQALGGRARLQVIVILAAVLGVSLADMGTVSAVAGELKNVFHIDNTQIGLLLAVVSFVGAIATLPMGALADRLQRRRLLMGTVALWAVMMVFSGLATSYLWLLAARVALGACVAAAWPCTASLTGDFFPARERAGIYGLIIAGEMVGVGVGYFVSGEVSHWLSWRASFFVMAVPALALVAIIWRYLPEPQRGGQSWLTVEDEDPAVASEPEHVRRSGQAAQKQASGTLAGGGGRQPIRERIRQRRIEPRRELVGDVRTLEHSWWRVSVYLLRLPTYRLLIIASALAYYFFAGVRAFSMIYFTEHYDLKRTTVSALVFVVGVCALAGVILGGRISERLLRRGRLTARIIVPAVALFVSVPFLGAGIWTRSAWLAVLLLSCGSAALAAALAPIDAARLDIVPAPMWGRGESGRMALRMLLEGGAPLLFGALSQWFGNGQRGLEWTFLLMLVPMLVAGSLALPARRSYPRDVATAFATTDHLRRARSP